jgi:hypothetical protein
VRCLHGCQQCQKVGETIQDRRNGHRRWAALRSTENCCHSAHTQQVNELIRKDRRITVREITAQLGAGRHAVQEMETLGFRKVCSRWVPRLLTEEHKTVRRDVSSHLLRRYAVEATVMTFC